MEYSKLVFKFLRIIKNIFNKSKPTKEEELSEEEYYENLFVKNEKWNNVNPNYDENKRWESIKKIINTNKVFEGIENPKILDLGCGRGWLTNLLSQFGEIVGIEPVGKVIEHARKIFPNIKFFIGTSKDLLKASKGEFDLIVSSEVIEHIKDELKKDFVADISKLLTKNGFVIITTPRKEAQLKWIENSKLGQPIEDWISENDLENLFLESNFKSIGLERIGMQQSNNSEELEIYQVWLFRKN
jgi:2-polyprenyl-3-methyl-5-hydroxy-6-metoxy-1,4-benzoquinol methylase